MFTGTIGWCCYHLALSCIDKLLSYYGLHAVQYKQKQEGGHLIISLTPVLAIHFGYFYTSVRQVVFTLSGFMLLLP